MYANRNEYRKRKPLAIGVEDYKRIVDKSYYYMDKTLLIRELLDQGGTVSLFTRPRRFGKTLALSMVKTFFESEIEVQKYDNSLKEEGYEEILKYAICFCKKSCRIKNLRFIPKDVADSYLTDSLTGILKQEYDIDEV